MEIGSDDLNIREDAWSFQITSSRSKFFFVRLKLPLSSTSQFAFSDFILRIGDNTLGLAALQTVFDHFQLELAKQKVVFENIHPGYNNEDDRAELLRRHDQIVFVVRKFADQNMHGLENAYLDVRDGKFDTIVEFE